MSTPQELKTRQEVFDYVAPLLLAQGQKSTGDFEYGSSCAYRGQNDCKCAIGHLIPDEEYSTVLEGVGINGLLGNPVCPPTLKRLMDNPDVGIYFLETLQYVHDGNMVEFWKDALLTFALQFKLNPIPETTPQ